MELLKNANTGVPTICVGQQGEMIARCEVGLASGLVIMGPIEGHCDRKVYDFCVEVAEGYALIVGQTLVAPLPPKETPPPDNAEEGLSTTGDQTSDLKVPSKKKAGKKKRTPKKRTKEAS